MSFLLLALIADTTPIHTTVADSTRVAFIAQTPVSWEDVEFDSLNYIRFTDSPLTDSIGYPELPMITCLVAFPDSVTPYLEYAYSDMRDQFVNPVYPAPAQVLSFYVRGLGRLGDAVNSARFEYESYFTSSSGDCKRTLGQFNLLGDPALDISDRIKYPNDCDLLIHESDITVSGYTYETSTGTELSMSFTVRNNGAKDSDEFDARITFSYDENSSIDYVSCDELAAGAEAEYEYTWDCARWFDPPMEITVKVEVDYLEECDDSWWGNNTASRNAQLNDTYPTESGWPITVTGVVNTTPLLVNLDEDTDLEIVRVSLDMRSLPHLSDSY